MTLQSLIVLGLIALFIGIAAWLWRAAGRRTTTHNAAKRAQRLEEQLAWDRMREDAQNKP